MDLLKILSFGAILLSVSACILVYISHRRTTARLDALTQANLGITSTIHSLISASMVQQSQMNGQGHSQGGSGSQMTNYSSNDNHDNTMMSNQIAERINVSDDDLSEESDDVSESDDDDITEDNDDDSVSSDDTEKNDNSLVIGDDSENTIHIVSLHLDNNEHNKFSDSHIEELDNIEPEDSEDDDDDDNLDIDIDELDDDNDNNNNDSIKDDDNHINFSVEKLDDNDGIKNNITDVEDDNNDDNDNDDMILPITTSKKTNKNKQQSDDDILSKTELFKHLKVDELRKLAIAKHNMSEDDVKKLKKPQLIQRLTQ